MDDKHVFISVEDTGSGIPHGDQEKIFEPLFTSKSRGMGVGLSICKSIVEAHGGRISSNARDGRGTVFRVELPG